MPKITFTIVTQYTHALREAVSTLRNRNTERTLAVANLTRRIVKQRAEAKQPPLRQSLLNAEVTAMRGKDWVTREADDNYASARADVQTTALLELVELQRRAVEQNEQIIHLLNDRLPRRIH